MDVEELIDEYDNTIRELRHFRDELRDVSNFVCF